MLYFNMNIFHKILTLFTKADFKTQNENLNQNVFPVIFFAILVALIIFGRSSAFLENEIYVKPYNDFANSFQNLATEWKDKDITPDGIHLLNECSLLLTLIVGIEKG